MTPPRGPPGTASAPTLTGGVRDDVIADKANTEVNHEDAGLSQVTVQSEPAAHQAIN